MTDITRKRGDTYADEFVLKSKVTGQPINLTGYTFLLTVDPNKEPTSAATNAYQLTGTILDAVGGRVEFAPTAMQADRVGAFFYDVQMVDGAGRKRTVVSGKYKYEQDITKT
jgi:hypothetical protein